jgi:hypothetical protein
MRNFRRHADALAQRRMRVNRLADVANGEDVRHVGAHLDPCFPRRVGRRCGMHVMRRCGEGMDVESNWDPLVQIAPNDQVDQRIRW